jgi:hypothetical protein
VRGAPDRIVFQTYADMEGYLWSLPRTDHASAGIATRLGAVPPQDLRQRVDRFLAEFCPGAKKEKCWAGLLPMAQDTSLWDSPRAGPGWALVGDAAGLVQPVTGEGIAYALWSAGLLAEAFGQEDPQVCEGLWRERCGRGFMAASGMLRPVDLDKGTYEIIFQVAMAMALSVPTKLLDRAGRGQRSATMVQALVCPIPWRPGLSNTSWDWLPCENQQRVWAGPLALSRNLARTPGSQSICVVVMHDRDLNFLGGTFYIPSRNSL